MQFVQIGMLGAMAALAIPVIVHLLFRNKPKTVELGTLQFLQAVLRDTARKRRVKRWVLLALRLGVVALLALLFARPYLLATENPIGDRLVVLLLDRSASMSLKSTNPLAKAFEAARSVMAGIGSNTQVEVATFDRVVHPFKDPSTFASAKVTPSPAGTDYGVAMAWARDQLVRSNRPRKELHVFTDLQLTGLYRGESAALPSDVEVKLIDFGKAFPKNVAVTAVIASPASVRPGGSTIVSAVVANCAPLPVSGVPLRLHLESAGATRDMEKTIDLNGSASNTITFELKEMPEGVWTGHVEVTAEKDELSFDDKRYLAIAVSPPIPVFVVDGDPGRSPFASETYFLRSALRLAPEGETFEKTPFSPRPLDVASDSSLPDPAKPGAVVLANAGDVSTSDARRLADYVRRGGGLVIFTGDRITAESCHALTAEGLGVGEIDGPAPAIDMPWRLETWNDQHPLLAPFRDPEHGDLRRPAFTTITRLKPEKDARVLATFRGGEPALIEKSLGLGKVLWFASACDRDWGDWPRGRMYVPLVHQMVGYVTGQAEGGLVRNLPASEGLEPGIQQADGLVRVVNADPFESDLARCTVQDFAKRFGFPPPGPGSDTSTQQVADKKARADERLRSDEVWPWFAAVLLALLLLEQFLANRTAA